MKPVPNTLKINWTLDGMAVAANTDEYILDQLPLSVGLHTLGLTLLDTNALTKDALHPTTHLSTLNWKIQRTTVGTLVVSASNQISYSIFPNPTAEALNVAFELESPEQVRLELHTADGRFLRVLSDERRAAGSHVVRQYVGDLPAGAYLLVLQFGAARMVEQVVRM